MTSQSRQRGRWHQKEENNKKEKKDKSGDKRKDTYVVCSCQSRIYFRSSVIFSLFVFWGFCAAILDYHNQFFHADSFVYYFIYFCVHLYIDFSFTLGATTWAPSMLSDLVLHLWISMISLLLLILFDIVLNIFESGFYIAFYPKGYNPGPFHGYVGQGCSQRRPRQ
jgi:hypothetical protein